MNEKENGEIRELRVDMRTCFSKLDAIMVEQQSAANGRADIREAQSDIKRELKQLRDDVDEIKPAVKKGKTMFLVFIGLIFGAGFSFSEIKTWLLRMVIIP